MQEKVESTFDRPKELEFYPEKKNYYSYTWNCV